MVQERFLSKRRWRNFMDTELYYAKLRVFDDLVKFVGMSPIPFLFHIEIKGKQVYFIQTAGLSGDTTIYYTEIDKKIKEKYVVFNRFRGEVSYSNRFSSDGQSTYIPVFELETTNIFKEYPPK